MNQRTAVVTGASSGFGKLTAQAFAADGWRVYATMRNAGAKNAASAADLRKAGINVVELDVTSDASVDAAAKTILGEAGTIDVLVNNAGTGHFGIAEAFTPAAVEAQFATNVVGPLRVNRAFLPSMREHKRGLVVFVSSVRSAACTPHPSGRSKPLRKRLHTNSLRSASTSRSSSRAHIQPRFSATCSAPMTRNASRPTAKSQLSPARFRRVWGHRHRDATRRKWQMRF